MFVKIEYWQLLGPLHRMLVMFLKSEYWQVFVPWQMILFALVIEMLLHPFESQQVCIGRRSFWVEHKDVGKQKTQSKIAFANSNMLTCIAVCKQQCYNVQFLLPQ